jgi:integrase
MASPGRLAKSKDFLLLRVGGRFALFQMLRLALADAAKRAGCTDSKPISPHRLRHYAGFRTIPGEASSGCRSACQCWGPAHSVVPVPGIVLITGL